MGWCSATEIFDTIAESLLEEGEVDPREILMTVAEALRDHDWDCECDSYYFDHPVVQDIFRELEPEWFEENE
jgi:hypothetical protein